MKAPWVVGQIDLFLGTKRAREDAELGAFTIDEYRAKRAAAEGAVIRTEAALADALRAVSREMDAAVRAAAELEALRKYTGAISDQPLILPPEIFACIGAFLDPITYARAAAASRDVRAVMLDRWALGRYVAANEKRFGAVLHAERASVGQPTALLSRLAGMWVMASLLRPTGARISSCCAVVATRLTELPKSAAIGITSPSCAIFPEGAFYVAGGETLRVVCGHVFLIRRHLHQVCDLTAKYTVSFDLLLALNYRYEIVGNGLGTFFVSRGNSGFRVQYPASGVAVCDACTIPWRGLSQTVCIDADGDVAVVYAEERESLFSGERGPVAATGYKVRYLGKTNVLVSPASVNLFRTTRGIDLVSYTARNHFYMKAAAYNEYAILSCQTLLVIHQDGTRLAVPRQGSGEWRIGPHGIEAEDGRFIEFLFKKK